MDDNKTFWYWAGYRFAQLIEATVIGASAMILRHFFHSLRIKGAKATVGW